MWWLVIRLSENNQSSSVLPVLCCAVIEYNESKHWLGRLEYKPMLRKQDASQTMQSCPNPTAIK